MRPPQMDNGRDELLLVRCFDAVFGRDKRDPPADQPMPKWSNAIANGKFPNAIVNRKSQIVNSPMQSQIANRKFPNAIVNRKFVTNERIGR